MICENIKNCKNGGVWDYCHTDGLVKCSNFACILKLPTYKELASELRVSESAIKQYNKRKRELMLKGLYLEQKNRHKQA